MYVELGAFARTKQAQTRQTSRRSCQRFDGYQIIWLLHCKKLYSVKCGQGFDCSVNRASMGHCTGTGEGGVVIIFKQRRSPANITAGANDLFFSSQSTRLQYKVQRPAVFSAMESFMEAVKTNLTRSFILTYVISKTSEQIQTHSIHI